MLDNLLVDYLKSDINSEDYPFKKNCNHLFGNVFLVRTQAGLKQAIISYSNAKDWLTEQKPSFKEIVDKLRFQNIPDFSTMKFPLLIEFIPIYIGYHGTEAYIKELS